MHVFEASLRNSTTGVEFPIALWGPVVGKEEEKWIW